MEKDKQYHQRSQDEENPADSENSEGFEVHERRGTMEAMPVEDYLEKIMASAGIRDEGIDEEASKVSDAASQFPIHTPSGVDDSRNGGTETGAATETLASTLASASTSASVSVSVSVSVGTDVPRAAPTAVASRHVPVNRGEGGEEAHLDLAGSGQQAPLPSSSNSSRDRQRRGNFIFQRFSIVLAVQVEESDETVLMVEGVKPRSHEQKLRMILGAVLLLSVIAAAVTVGVVLGTQTSSTTVGAPTAAPANASTEIPAPDIVFSNASEPDTSIGDFLGQSGDRFAAFHLVALLAGLVPMLQDRNQTLTVLALTADDFNSLAPDFIQKFVLPVWAPHTLHLMQQHIIPGVRIYTWNMTTGITATNLNGNPVTFSTNPLEANGVALHSPNVELANGVLHSCSSTLPVAWRYTTFLYQLERLNEERGGDLSIFLSLSNASSALETALREDKGIGTPTTLFAPINAAFDSLGFPIHVTQSNRASWELLLDNHVINANFEINSWRVELSDRLVGPDRLRLRTWSANDLILQVGDPTNLTVTTSETSTATIVQEGILCEYGVLQLVDSLLLPPGFNVSDLQ